jgi:hypothetical protein
MKKIAAGKLLRLVLDRVMRATDLRYVALAMVAVVLLCTSAGAAYGADATKMIDAAPFIENDRSFDTVRPIAETFGIYVEWDPAEQKITMTKGAFQVVMEVGSDELTIVSHDETETLSMDTAPILRDGRVYLPTRLWAEAFGLEVVWHDGDGSVAISEGTKTLVFTPGSQVLSLSGGHFLKLYDKDERLRFYYPEDGHVAIVWDGYAEILLTTGDEEYVIVAVNAGAGRSDPTNYTLEEFDRLIYKNADAINGSVKKLSDAYFGVPAYRIAGLAARIPQVGVIFLRNGHLCGLTIEVKGAPSDETVQEGASDATSEDGAEIALQEDKLSEDDELFEDEKKILYEKLEIVDAILDEIMASFAVK